MAKAIGKAQCQAMLLLDASRQPIVAGVVRIGNENKIVVAQISGDQVVRVIRPNLRPDQLASNPAFSCWELASMEEANSVVQGKTPTRHQSSLGGTSVEDFMGRS